MSIILKGIDMPKEGLTTNVNILSNGDIYVSAFDGKRTNYEVLRNQAIQIPKEHGRLIDGDELKKRLYGYERWTGIDEAPYEYAEKEVYDAPTILEAEVI